MLENAISPAEERSLCQALAWRFSPSGLGETCRDFEKTDAWRASRDAIYEGTRLAMAEAISGSRSSRTRSAARTRTNTLSAYIHWDLVPGDVFQDLVQSPGRRRREHERHPDVPAGAGLGASRTRWSRRLTRAASNPAPVIVGVGVGGNSISAWLAKKALLPAPLGSHNADPFYADLEKRLLERINMLASGPMGGAWAGASSALARSRRILPLPHRLDAGGRQHPSAIRTAVQEFEL